MLGPVVADLKGTSVLAEEIPLLTNPYLGGVILFKRNFESYAQLKELILEIRSHRPELLISVDQEGGRVQRFREDFTRLPALQRLGKLFEQDPVAARELATESAWLMATELEAVGVDISFAPVVDADDNQSEVIGDRAFSKSVQVVIDLGRAYIEGMTQAGMAATLKHFPGHGYVTGDSHVSQPVDQRAYAEVEKSDMQPFVSLLPLAGAVMPAHIRFPNVDDDSVGFSEYWLQNILRQKLQFKGVIFSDDLSMEGASVVGGVIERAKAALQAGCNGILVCNAPDKAEEVLRWLQTCGWSIDGKLDTLKRPVDANKGFEQMKENPRWKLAHQKIKNLLSER